MSCYRVWYDKYSSFQVNESTGVEIDIPVPIQYDELGNEIQFRSSLSLPARYLDYGRHKFQLNVTMEPEPDVYTIAEVSIYITTTDLVLNFLNGASLKS